MPPSESSGALNLEDIARLCGVSRSTVSRVINDSPHVRPATRERVLAAIEKHNYAPNAAARSLVTHTTHVIGVYIPELVTNMFADPYFPSLLQAITGRATIHGYDVMLWLRGEDEDPARLVQRILDNRQVDGLILASTALNDPLLAGLIARERAYVLNGRPWPHEHAVNYVDADNYHGAYQAVAHLANLGRCRIATITGRTDMRSGHDRLEGYCDARRDLGLEPDEALVVEGTFQEASGYHGMKQLLALQPDAVFCGSDLCARGALRALREAGRRVPDDVAVVGFGDDPAVAAISDPPLTTIRQPVTELGHLAIEGLIGLLDGDVTPPYQKVLGTELIIRASCGAP